MERIEQCGRRTVVTSSTVHSRDAAVRVLPDEPLAVEVASDDDGAPEGSSDSALLISGVRWKDGTGMVYQGCRGVLHLDVTTHPTSRCSIQQLREASPCQHALCYLIYNNDSIVSREVKEAIETSPLAPKRTASRWMRLIDLVWLVSAWCSRSRWRRLGSATI